MPKNHRKVLFAQLSNTLFRNSLIIHFFFFLFFLNPLPRRFFKNKNPPAFIPQTPFCGREISRGFAKIQSPENSFRKTESELKPRHTNNTEGNPLWILRHTNNTDRPRTRF